MQNPNYGACRGIVTDHGPQEGGNPHYNLFLKGDGKTYRVPFNMESVDDDPDTPPDLQYFYDDH